MGKHFISILNRIISGEVAPIMDDYMATHLSIRIRNAPSNKSDITTVINALKWSKIARSGAIHAELFTADPTVSVVLFIPVTLTTSIVQGRRLGQCSDFGSLLHLFFIDFEKGFDSMNREFI